MLGPVSQIFTLPWGGILPPSKFYQYFWQRVSHTFTGAVDCFERKIA
jgi:hypothetical protein